MKIRTDHFKALEACIAPILARTNAEEVRNRYRADGFTHKKYRWDVFYASGFMKGEEFQPSGETGQRGNCGALYEYLNDDHIDTALRTLVPAYTTEAVVLP